MSLQTPIPQTPAPALPAGVSNPALGLKKRSTLTSLLEFGIIHEQSDLEAAFGLVYESYIRAGLTDANETGIRLTPFHLLPTTEVFSARYEGNTVSTVSLIGDGYLGLPMEGIYSKEIKQLRDRGCRMAEIGCLADRRNSPVRFIELFATMGRMLARVAKVRGYDGLVAAVHPRHARLYQRILPFEQIGEVIECPYANGNPAVMVQLVFDDHLGSSLYERFFGVMASGFDTTLRHWSKETREYFKGHLQTDQERKDQQVSGQLAFAALTGQYVSRVEV
ncbi:N-acyl amino acid synthase FeeM domain-containing protein [Rubripirellula reticaptiva]|uniref:N-acyl amino acid synthase FeeM catalytic core domain-containing protein n=1 Tax=Rubripirellula reticaptiva TaxID=2528013 RepID=A0A5C6F592_9BACT|nr:long-chain N-acyl amino acid synthase [Rubripirellula reticaptiva]TWU55700.1 hypothetical protein Poly59_20000 [Rubripirellula reticaptiva]